ncbi:TauD/TfdA family dioxygenase [Pseudomonas sp.]|uniref:TauD/TfdA dioxygenase family protein n=1 Tax=Pseudomonas sp. TaxID=306 RepID=UPI002614F879|nr:TauD/TfdA family dioxygenase [Pseudomonas sp.]
MVEPRFIVKAMPVGAKIVGLTPGDEQDPAVRAGLYRAWLDNGVLLFTEVNTVERHLALSEVFGELEEHPFPEVRSKVHPMLIDISGDRRSVAYVYDEADVLVNRIAWHRDTAYTRDICKGAMLRMIEVPAEDGETMIADTAKAYDDLPEELKKRLGGLEYKATLRMGPREQTRPGAFWSTARPATPQEDPQWGGKAIVDGDDPKIIANYPSVVLPAMLTHPESGRRCIFLSPTYVDFFIGMSKEESEDLLHKLAEHMLQPKYIYKHRWSPNEAIIWDNRRCMHAGFGNKIDQRRYGLRTTLAGAIRVGRFFEKGAKAQVRHFAD